MSQTAVGVLILPSCSSRDIPEYMAQDCVPGVLGYPQRGRLHSLSGRSIPVLGDRTRKTFFLTFR